MSETMATRITTVSRVRQRSRFHALGPLVLTLGAAELGVRLLRPRQPPFEPAPVELETYFSSAEIERGRRFVRPQLALGAVRGAIELAALIALVRRPPRALRAGGRGPQSHPVAGGALAGAGLVVGFSVLPLPLAAVSRRRAIAVGLITQSWGGWAVDLVKQTVIEAGLAGAGGAGVLAVIRRYPRRWWLAAAGGMTVFGALLATLAPVVLEPVFNDFTPLPEGETRDDVLELARAAGVQVRSVYSIDASRRTTAANAYVSGLGPTKRVVLFDTLLDRYGRDEVRVVVAHELAHVRGRDVWRAVAYAALVAPGAALAVQRLSWSLSSERDTPAVLPVLALSAAAVMAPVGLLGNRLTRALERHADAFSLELSDAPDAFISFERTIALQNVAYLDPPRWLTTLTATHPPTGERIGAAISYKNQAGEARPLKN
jgi:STE24 endopeptidase